MDMNEKDKRNYIKPVMGYYDVRMNSLLCSSPSDPSEQFYLGGGGVYNDDSIWDNGDDY